VTSTDWATFVRQFAAEPAYFSEVARETRAQTTRTVSAAPSQPNLAAQLEEASPARRRVMLIAFVGELAARVLGLDAANSVGEDVPLHEFGLDSLMAVELRNLLGAGLGLKRALPATLVYDYPTVEAIGDYLLQQVFQLDARTDEKARTEPVAETAGGSAVGVLDVLEELSDEEIDRLFREQLGQVDDGQ